MIIFAAEAKGEQVGSYSYQSIRQYTVHALQCSVCLKYSISYSYLIKAESCDGVMLS